MTSSTVDGDPQADVSRLVHHLPAAVLAALAVAALVVAAGQLVPGLDVGERRWLPAIVAAIAVLVAAELVDPPPAAGTESLEQGAWLAFAAALVMLAGAILTVGRIRFCFSRLV